MKLIKNPIYQELDNKHRKMAYLSGLTYKLMFPYFVPDRMENIQLNSEYANKSITVLDGHGMPICGIINHESKEHVYLVAEKYILEQT